MKNRSMWVLALVLLLVGAAIWREVQFRNAPRAGSSSPSKHASMPQPAPQQPSGHDAPPTNERGQLIG